MQFGTIYSIIYSEDFTYFGVKRLRVSFCTLGCKVNQYETVIMEQDFTARGYEIVPFGEKTDVTVINTCAVTEESARKS